MRRQVIVDYRVRGEELRTYLLFIAMGSVMATYKVC